ncbi:MAG TPA: hypothetical protein VFA25_04165, partial [Actinomycetota bacterium]|nr:hypothetical protein [Actinomycetota bacterium]
MELGAPGVTQTTPGISATESRPATSGEDWPVELGKAARKAAAMVDPSVALIAWVDKHNTPSRRMAERIGLTNQG